MKKNVILAAAALTLALTGCKQADSRQALPSAEESTAAQAIEISSEGETDEKELSQEESQQTSEQTTQSKSEEGLSQSTKASFTFDALSDRVFYFSSGAGAWYTELFINNDGTFQGHFQDADMGDMADAYPGGTLYECTFHGKFEDLEKVDEFTYQMRLSSISYEQEPEKTEILDGVRLIYSTAYGLDDGENFYLYLPGKDLASLPEDFRGWVGYYNWEASEDTVLPFYGLHNIQTGDGFSSSMYEKQSLSERIALEISFAENSSAELEAKLQEAVTQQEMNQISQELFQTWDDTLNIVWKLLESELDDATMNTLRAEERAWIASKEEKVTAAGLECEGGSIQPLIESSTAEELTRERVYELAKYAK